MKHLLLLLLLKDVKFHNNHIILKILKHWSELFSSMFFEVTRFFITIGLFKFFISVYFYLNYFYFSRKSNIAMKYSHFLKESLLTYRLSFYFHIWIYSLSKFWFWYLCFFFHNLTKKYCIKLVILPKTKSGFLSDGCFSLFKIMSMLLYYLYWLVFTMLFLKIRGECFISYLKCYLFINAGV